jgi:hypothetical protein
MVAVPEPKPCAGTPYVLYAVLRFLLFHGIHRLFDAFSRLNRI